MSGYNSHYLYSTTKRIIFWFIVFKNSSIQDLCQHNLDSNFKFPPLIEKSLQHNCNESLDVCLLETICRRSKRLLQLISRVRTACLSFGVVGKKKRKTTPDLPWFGQWGLRPFSLSLYSLLGIPFNRVGETFI